LADDFAYQDWCGTRAEAWLRWVILTARAFVWTSPGIHSVEEAWALFQSGRQACVIRRDMVQAFGKRELLVRILASGLPHLLVV
jgi:hypothetical protein